MLNLPLQRTSGRQFYDHRRVSGPFYPLLHRRGFIQIPVVADLHQIERTRVIDISRNVILHQFFHQPLGIGPVPVGARLHPVMRAALQGSGSSSAQFPFILQRIQDPFSDGFRNIPHISNS